jgi:hypothetical protein
VGNLYCIQIPKCLGFYCLGRRRRKTIVRATGCSALAAAYCDAYLLGRARLKSYSGRISLASTCFEALPLFGLFTVGRDQASRLATSILTICPIWTKVDGCGDSRCNGTQCRAVIREPRALGKILRGSPECWRRKGSSRNGRGLLKRAPGEGENLMRLLLIDRREPLHEFVDG